MSRISRILNLGINVEATNAEALDKVHRKVKDVVTAVAELKRLSGDLGGAQEAFGALQEFFKGVSGAEQVKALSQVVRIEQAMVSEEAQLTKLRAENARLTRDYAGAVQILAQAQGKFNTDSREYLNLENQKIRLINEETRAVERLEASRRRYAQQFESKEAQRVAQQSRLLAAQGNLTGAIGNIAVNSGDFAGDDRTKLLLLQAQLERRYRSEVTQTAAAKQREAEQQVAELQRIAKLQVDVALAAKDYAAALAVIRAEQSRVSATSAEWLTLERRRLDITSAQTRAIEAQAAAVVRRNQANYNAIAGVTLRDAELLKLQGNKPGAVSLIESRLGTFASGSDQETRLLVAKQRILNEINAEHERAPSLIGRATDALSGGLNMVLRVLGAFFLLRAGIQIIGGTIKAAIFDPLIGIAKEALTVTDRFKTLEITFAGIAGNLTASRSLVRDIVRAADGLPITPLEAVEAVRQTAFIPSVASRLQRPGQERDEFLSRIERTIVGLGTINPTQGPQGAGFALREALAGQFRSLRFRFDISPDIVAATIGKRQSDLRRDPELALQAVNSFVDAFVGREVIDELGNTLKGQGKKLRGALELFFAEIGKAGFYESFISRLKTISDALTKFVGSDAGTNAAKRISLALEEFFGTVINIGSRVLSVATGTKVDLNAVLNEGNVENVATVFTDIIVSLKDFAKEIVTVGGEIASLIAGLGGMLGIQSLAQKKARIAELEAMGPGILQPTTDPIWNFTAVPARGQELMRLRTEVDQIQGIFAPREKAPRFDPALLKALGMSDVDLGGVLDSAKTSHSGLQQSVLSLSTFFQTFEDALRETSQNIGPDLRSIESAGADFEQGVGKYAGKLSGDFGAATDAVTKLLALAGDATHELILTQQDIQKIDTAIDFQSKIRDVPGFGLEIPSGPVPDLGRMPAGSLDDMRQSATSRLDALNKFIVSLYEQVGRIDKTIKGAGSVGTQLQRAGASRLRFVEEQIKSLSPRGQDTAAGGVLGDVFAGLRTTPAGPTDLEGLRRVGFVPRDQESLNRLVGVIETRLQSQIAQKVDPNLAGNTAIQTVEQLIKLYQEFGDTSNEVFDTLGAELDKLKDQFDELRRVSRDFAQTTSSGFQEAFSGVLVDSITNGAKQVEDILRGLASTIAKAVTDALTRILVVESVLNPLLNSVFGSTLPTNNLFGLSNIPHGVGNDVGVVGQAQGGVIIPAAAGLLTRTQGLIPLAGGRRARTVEDGTPEAIIPLRGGGIPVRFPGMEAGGRRGEQPGITIMNVLDPVSVAQSAARRSPNTFVNPVVADIRGRGVTRRSIRAVRR